MILGTVRRKIIANSMIIILIIEIIPIFRAL